MPGELPEPGDRLPEILFGLIMVLTSTGSLRVATADLLEVRDILISAQGCSIAWGLIAVVEGRFRGHPRHGAAIDHHPIGRLGRALDGPSPAV